MPTRLTLQWRNVNVSVEKPGVDPSKFERVRIYVDGDAITLRDRRGIELDTLASVETESVDRRTYRFTAEDGTVWTATRNGCNCGSK